MEMDGEGPFLGGELPPTFQEKRSRLDSVTSKLARSARASTEQICPLCSCAVQPISSFLTCSQCKKWVHADCDSESALDDYTCVNCRSNPLVCDAMLAVSSPSSLLATEHTEQPPSGSARDFDFFSQRSPTAESMDHFDFPIAPEERLSGSSITSTDSARNSPSFCPDNSPLSEDQDDIPIRGAHSTRGGRGGKKKPGGRGGTIMKTRSGGQPPSGAFLDKLGKSDRGKRGKARGKASGASNTNVGKGSGRGRGRAAAGSGVTPASVTSRCLSLISSTSSTTLSTFPEESIEVERARSRTTDESVMGIGYIRTLVLIHEGDNFINKTPLCLVCGSIGKGIEQSMIACSSCAQTYHTYCVNLHDKMNTTVVGRGWRCLDCTVCEGCGKGEDDSRLILCEDCDVAYHTYCMTPPLSQMPNGIWRCRACSKCRRCNQMADLTKDGVCQECLSLRKCPKCCKLYQLGETIIRCSTCLRWYHGRCEELYSEEMLEAASLNKMRCSVCRPNNRIAFPQEQNVVLCDNVALKREVDEVFQGSRMMRSSSFLRSNSLVGDGMGSSLDLYGSVDEEPNQEESDYCAVRGVGRGMGRGGPGRRMPKLGVGGFFVKIPRHRVFPGEDETIIDKDGNKTLKKARKPRRSQLEDAYPPVIQEGFFGMKAVEGKTLVDTVIDEPVLSEYQGRGRKTTEVGGEELGREAAEALRNDLNENGILEDVNLNDYMNLELNLDLFDQDDDEFTDNLNDAYAVVQEDGFDMSRSSSNSLQMNADAPSSSSSSLHVAPSQQSAPSHAPQLSRSNSQMDGAANEKVNPATERWEEDEPLGDKATKAAVLYCNMCVSDLRVKYPDWNERVKQIHRIWRQLGPEERQKYVNMARENRANRVKPPRQPRQPKTTPQHTASPTTNAPPGQQPLMGTVSPSMSMDEKFKVPMVPAVIPPGQPMPTPQIGQQSIETTTHIDHLPPELQNQYNNMKKKAADLNHLQETCENDLTRMRKQKKNLAAKRRQMIKSAGLDAEGKPNPNIDLNENDRAALSLLVEGIPNKLKELEGVKKDIKSHISLVHDFESKYRISSLDPSDPSSQAVSGQGIVNRMAAGPFPPGMARPPFQQLIVPQQLPYSMVNRPIEERPLHMAPMMNRVPARRMRQRTPYMARGMIHFDRLQTQGDRDIYDLVDEMLERVHEAVEQPLQKMDMAGGPLKRLLEPSLPHPMIHPQAYEQTQEPRQKKKRQTQKKTGAGSNELELMMERVKTQLSLCDPLPKKALEPVPRNEPAAFATMGIGDLNEKNDKRMLSCVRFGELQLSFLPDVYSQLRLEPPAEPLSMSRLAPHAKMAILAQMASNGDYSLPPLLRDQQDEESVSGAAGDLLKMMLSGIEKGRGILRMTARVPECITPTEPHRIAFHQPKEELEDVQVTMEIVESVDVEKGEVARRVIEELSAILGGPPIQDYHLDTPPASPSSNADASFPSEVKTECARQGPPCRFCEKEMTETIVTHSMTELGLAVTAEQDHPVTFCSMTCYFMFVAKSNVALSPDHISRAEQHVDERTLNQLKQIYAESFAKCINQGTKIVKTEPSIVPSVPTPVSHPSTPIDSLLTSPRDTRYVMDEGRRDHVQVIRVSDLAHTVDGTTKKERRAGEDWKVYSTEILNSYIRIGDQKKELATMQKRGIHFCPLDDTRSCVLCGLEGDGESHMNGRLLNLDATHWIHVNCALWSSEVYEAPNGALINVASVVGKAAYQRIICRFCGKPGATVNCYKADCPLVFHMHCAASTHGKFLKDKTFMCSSHQDIHPDVIVGREPLRRLFVQREEKKLLEQLFEVVEGGPRTVIRLGSLTFRRLGQLLPEQLKAFHSSRHIFPLGYNVKRTFWSPFDYNKRVQYECRIEEKEGRPLFVIQLEERTWTGTTATEAWKDVFGMVEQLRFRTDCLRFFPNELAGETLFGLNESSVSMMTESLPGVDGLFTYTFRHGGAPMMDLPLAENPSGCARCEPRMRTLIKHKQRAMTSSASSGPSSSSHRTRNGGNAYLDMMKGSAFYSSLLKDNYGMTEQSYSAYQKMRRDWRQTIYLARSSIQGLGLYAKRDIDMGAMIMEYKGESIRSEVGEVREKRYEAQNRGVYMFRVNEEYFIDATMAGGPARYINHSCDPNCATHIMSVGPNSEDKKIIITANRPIKAGEELTYDYQFEEEQTDDKIACLCGAPNCQKWMN